MIISKFFFYLDICHPFLLRIQLKLFFELNFFILFPLEILIANTNFSFHGSLIYILYCFLIQISIFSILSSSELVGCQFQNRMYRSFGTAL